MAASAGSGGYGYGPPKGVVGSPFGGYGLRPSRTACAAL
jgi:hypothetical protein